MTMVEFHAAQAYIIEKQETVNRHRNNKFEPFTEDELAVFEQIRNKEVALNAAR